MLNKGFIELRKYKKDIFWTLIFLILFYFLLPDKEYIINTYNEIKDAELSWIVLGNVLFYLTIPLYAIQLFVLSKIKLNYWITFKVQMSVLFINKILPSSISSFVVNSFYLEEKGLKASQIASVISMKALTSSIPFTLLFIFAFIIGINQFNFSSSSFSKDIDLSKIFLILISFILLFLFLIYRSSKLKKIILKSFLSFWEQFKSYKEKPINILIAGGTGFLAPLIGITVLLLSAKSVGIEISFVQSFLIYTLSTTLANAVPVPGGIGAAEAGLFAGFTFLGFSPAESMAAAVIYRLITFWIPFIPGFYFFLNLRKNVFKNFSIKEKISKSKNKFAKK